MTWVLEAGMTLPSPRAISSTSAKDDQATKATKSAPMMNMDAVAKSGGRSSLASISHVPLLYRFQPDIICHSGIRSLQRLNDLFFWPVSNNLSLFDNNKAISQFEHAEAMRRDDQRRVVVESGLELLYQLPFRRQ